jgi:glycosyltransferase 2 family protein
MAKLKTLIKAGLSILLLAFLIQRAEPLKIAQVFEGIWQNDRIVYLWYAFAIYVISMLIFTLRWRILVKGYGLRITTLDLFKYYWIGLFFNNFLPTSIGGDIIRIYHLVEKSGDRTAGFTSVITERLLGIASTLILALLSFFVLTGKLDNRWLVYIAGFLLAAIVAFFILVFNENFISRLERMITSITLWRLGERFMKLVNAIRFYHNAKSIYLHVLGVSLIGQIVIIIMTYSLSRTIGVEVPLTYMFVVVPVSFLLTMLPSINGIGFREGGYIVLLGEIGIGKAEAISLSFLSILIPMLISIGGGILFVFNRNTIKKEELNFVGKNL